MKKQVPKQQTEETFIDKLKGIGLVGIPLWILLFVANLYSFFHDCKITASFGKKVVEMKSF